MINRKAQLEENAKKVQLRLLCLLLVPIANICTQLQARIGNIGSSLLSYMRSLATRMHFMASGARLPRKMESSSSKVNSHILHHLARLKISTQINKLIR